MVKYVFGHQTPDTDAIVSAMVYAEFLNNQGIQAKAVKLGEINKETKFVLEQAEAKEPETIERLPEGSEVILMDHNEKKQTISNIDDLEISAIIDHHKFNLQTSKPINIRAENIGSSCSVLYKMFSEQGYDFSRKEAILLMSGIISDTLYFRSPTTTEQDREIVRSLQPFTGIKNPEKYSLKMFDAKSDIEGMSIKELIKSDYKVFDFKKGKYGVGVLETTDPKKSLKKKNEIIKALAEIKKEEKLKGIFLSIIDILNGQNKTIVSDEDDAEVIEKSFSNAKKLEENVYSLGDVISRKKQIIPELEVTLG